MAGEGIKKVLGVGKDVIKTLDPTQEGLTDLDKILKSMIPTAGASALASGLNDSLKFVIEMDQTFAKLAQKMGVGEQMSSLMKENFATFDKHFLEKLPRWKQVIRIKQRILDPAILYVDWKNDSSLPSLGECKERAKIDGIVTHNALEDAWDVIELPRKKY